MPPLNLDIDIICELDKSLSANVNLCDSQYIKKHPSYFKLECFLSHKVFMSDSPILLQ